MRAGGPEGRTRAGGRGKAGRARRVSTGVCVSYPNPVRCTPCPARTLCVVPHVLPEPCASMLTSAPSVMLPTPLPTRQPSRAWRSTA